MTTEKSGKRVLALSGPGNFFELGMGDGRFGGC